MFVLKNCKLIPQLSGVEFEHADIVISGDTIYDIVPTGKSYIGHETVDVAGKTVIPGLINLHTHLFYLSQHSLENPHTKDWGTLFFEYHDFAMEHLRQGYTTVRDCGSMEFMAVYLRNAINEGRLPGPTIYTSGLALTPTMPGNFDQRFLLEVDSPEEVRKASRDMFKGGADYIKYIATGSFSNKGSVPKTAIAAKDELRSAVEVAESFGSYVGAHCHALEGIRRCIEVGVRTIEHGTYIDAQTVQWLKSCDSYLIPTLSVMSPVVEDDVLETLKNEDPHIVQRVLAQRNEEPEFAQCLTTAYKAGLKLGWGTDISMPTMKYAMGMEFLARQKYLGMSNLDMLLQATKYSAEIVRIDDKVGTVAKGKKADLLVIDGDPIADIHLMCKPFHAIYKGGKPMFVE